ncbi:MAG: hypothetical protein VW438_00280 [Euryarchaeota archaeon]
MVNLNLADHNTQVLYEEVIDPEQQLWRSVLRQAFEDAFLGAKLHLCNYERQDARSFVTERSTNFDYVCELAGLSPDYVWDKLQQFKNKKEKYRDVLELVA